MITRTLPLLLAAAISAAPAADLGRGRLLYESFCGHCHITEIHHRSTSGIRAPADLRHLVDVWQREMGLGWSEEEIEDVSGWLDWAFYRLSPEG